MRFWFLLLLIANAVCALGIYLAEHGPDAAAQAAALQINPDKVKLMKPSTPAAGSPTASTVSTAAAARTPVCLEWGAVAATDTARAEAALAPLQLGERLTRRESGDALYWVYIRGLKGKPEADKKASELKALGVADFSVMQDGAEWLVSLGAFKTEEAANNYFAQVKQKGVRSAVVGQRGGRSITYVVREPDDALTARLTAFKTDFPDAALKPVTCAASPAATTAAATAAP